jgi:hypothetical protein
VAWADAMLTIRTSKFNTTIKKTSSVLFLWFHNSKGWFVGKPEVIRPATAGVVSNGETSP